MTMHAVSQHIRVLEWSGLVSRGRHRQSRPVRLELTGLQEREHEWPEPAAALTPHLTRDGTVAAAPPGQVVSMIVSVPSPARSPCERVRAGTVALMLVPGAVALVGGALAGCVNRTVLDADSFADRDDTLRRDPAVSTALCPVLGSRGRRFKADDAGQHRGSPIHECADQDDGGFGGARVSQQRAEVGVGGHDDATLNCSDGENFGVRCAGGIELPDVNGVVSFGDE